MNRIEGMFAALKQAGQRPRVLMPFVCAGYPRPGLIGELLPALEQAGASIVEVGFPFSDPIADGPVIAAAMHEALAAGATAAKVFEEVHAAREKTGLGLVAMVSASIVHRLGGPKGFAKSAREAGFDGLIVPDVPVEHSGPVRDAAGAENLSLSLMVAPTTPPNRAETIVAACSGFVYLLARTGITGEQSDAPDVSRQVAGLREFTELPIACGFGISSPRHVAAVVAHADAAIVGSALIRRMGSAAAAGLDVVAAAEAFTRELAGGLTAF